MFEYMQQFNPSYLKEINCNFLMITHKCISRPNACYIFIGDIMSKFWPLYLL